ncbi:hypothetical protein PFISCL1PPCAC_574, partial [Pristionchus fissidentatus]
IHLVPPYLLCSDVLRVPSRIALRTSIESMQLLRRSQLRLARFDLLLPLEYVFGEGRVAAQDRVGRLSQVLVETEGVLE